MLRALSGRIVKTFNTKFWPAHKDRPYPLDELGRNSLGSPANVPKSFSLKAHPAQFMPLTLPYPFDISDHNITGLEHCRVKAKSPYPK